MNSYLLSPKVDFVFKKIFGNEKHPRILISFLNAVMKPDDEIYSVEIKNSDIEKEHIEDKYSRLDIKAITNKGEYINIEIQVKNEYNMIKRSLYYWSKMFESQIVKGDNYNKLAKTVCINILDFKYLNNESYHSVYRLKEVQTNEELTDTIELHFIEIPKLKDIDESEEITDMLEAWVSFIKDPSSRIIEKIEMNIDDIKEAKQELLKLSADSKERRLYEMRTESMLEKVSLLEGAEEKGITVGESRKAIEIARKSIESGLEDGLISSLTGLTIEEIRKLKYEV